MILRIIICAVAAYLIGGINGGIAVSKLIKHEDIREKGSGNAGFTNIKRVYGIKLALLVCGIDMAKTIGACVMGWFLLPENPVAGQLIAGIFVQLGHIFPIYFGFKGGKGFICGMAAIAAADWRVFLVALFLLFSLSLLTKYVSIASMSASLSYAVMFAVFHNDNLPVVLLASAMSLIILLTHIPNIKRLIKGTENKTYFFKKKPEKVKN